MPAHRMLIGLAVLALGVGVLACVEDGARPCERTGRAHAIAGSADRGYGSAACPPRVLCVCLEGPRRCTAACARGGSVCGDGLCGPAENCSTCPADCGS